MEKQKLNSTVVYILAILGFLCCCLGGIGFVFAGIAFYIAHSKLKEAELNPENYDNISGMKTAKTIAMIVLIINLLYFAYSMYRVYTIGWDEIMEQSRIMQEEWMKGMNEGS
jgi:Trk-type K+ transport system membrane component